jgi:zinc transport system substrate-binding protein
LYRYRAIGVLCLVTLLAWTARAGAAPPTVVATILPVHSLVSAVTEGLVEPRLLIHGGASPHAFSLSPSDARALHDADLIFRVGPSMESFLTRLLASGGLGGRLVTLAEAPGMAILPLRQGGLWQPGHGHTGHDDDDHDDGDHGPGPATVDGHLWLSPANARVIVDTAAEALAGADPAGAAAYRANAEAARTRIAELDADLRRRLAPVRERGFIVFHDAYQYFERHFGLAGIGSIALSPEQQPGARRLTELRRALVARGARCVFAEPQFEPSLVATVVEDTGTRRGTLDPLGADLEPGPDAWFELMTRLADNLVRCLAAD